MEVTTARLRIVELHVVVGETSNAIVTVFVAEGAMVVEPLHTTVPNGSLVVILSTQFELESNALNVISALGTASFTVTSVAVSEPKFVVVIVYMIVPPRFTDPEPIFVMARSTNVAGGQVIEVVMSALKLFARFGST